MAEQYASQCSPPSETDIDTALCHAVKRLRARYGLSDAEDIVHEAFLRFWPDPAAQGAHWRFVLKYDLLNAEAAFVRRKRRTEKHLLWQDQLADTDEAKPRADFANLADTIEVTATTQCLIALQSLRNESDDDTLLNTLMKTLSQRERRILQGLYEGRSLTAMAHETGEKPVTLRKQAQRLREKLQNDPIVQELRAAYA